MTLKTYHQKRNFKKTPEPKGSPKDTKCPSLYVIQKHAASHLHYDLRLELNGVLLSWAIPKGPSLDPKIKRLAMHVEDHPIAYASFEGVIPLGEYGGGTVMLWDKGKWYCENNNPKEAYKNGILTFTLKAKKLNGRWKLLRMHNNDKAWLLIKIKDSYAKSSNDYDITIAQPYSVLTKKSLEEIAENHTRVWTKYRLSKMKDEKKTYLFDATQFKNLVKRSMPVMIIPQLATLVDEPPQDKNWVFEIKFDGYRLLAIKKNGKTHLFTRNGNDWTRKFLAIRKAINKLGTANLIIDGEILVLNADKHSDFQLLQNSIKDARNNTFYYYTFDLLYYDQYDLKKLPLIERKNILSQIINNQPNPLLVYSDHISGNGKTILKKSCRLGLEGIIAKNKNGLYTSGRNKDWLKIKCMKRQEFIIGGFTPSSQRHFFRSLMLGSYNSQGELIYHGNVGTGFTRETLKNLHALLQKNISFQMPFANKPPGSRVATWVRPVLVAEIEFTDWTESNTLRHPSFKGLRIDKSAKNIIKEKTIRLKNLKKKGKAAKRNEKSL